MNLELRIVKGQCVGYQKVIRRPERILIGREASCDLTISDPLLSRQHCLIEFNHDAVKVIDLKSRNGSFVNGNRIQEIVVNIGDEIKVGRHLLQIFPASRTPETSHFALCAQCSQPISDKDVRNMKAVRHGAHYYCENCIEKGIEARVGASITRTPSGTSTTQAQQEQKKVIPTRTMPSIPQNIGNYQILEPLGEGGMGVVYKARHTFLDTTVALKVIKEELAQHADILKRFLQEAKLGGGLKHPHILQIQDGGESEGNYFIAMEFFDGKDVASLIKSTSPLNPAQVTQMAIQMTDALEYAHRGGVIHRDVKPSNIMISPEQNLTKLADFGLAKAWHNSGAHQLTASGQTLGTIQYISPEQLEDSRNVGPQTDIFSLGASLYYALAGTPPFGEQPIGTVINNILRSEPPPIPNTPKPLFAILQKTMAKNKAHRYASMEQFKQALLKL